MSASERGDLVTLIKSEISEIHSRNASTGLTTWILLSALAGILWLFLNELERAKFTTDNVLLLIPLVFFVYTTIALPSRIIGLKDAQTSARFIYPHAMIPGNTFGFVLWLSIVCLLVYSTYRTHGISFSYYVIATYIFLTFLFLSLLVLSVIVRINLPIPKSLIDNGNIQVNIKFKKYKSLGLLFWVSLVGLSLYGFLSATLTKYSSITFDDIKLTCSILCGCVLLILLSKVKAKKPLLIELIEIRRELLLGGVSTEKAKKQCRIALSGSYLSDIFSDEIRQLLESIRQFDLELHHSQSEIHILKKYENDENQISSLEKAKVTGAVCDLITKRLESAADIMLNTIVEDKWKLKKKVSKYTYFLNSSNEIDWLLEINDTISNRIDEYNALVFSAFKTIKRCTNEESARKMIDSLNAIDGINFNRETGQLSQQSHKNYRNLTSVSS